MTGKYCPRCYHSSRTTSARDSGGSPPPHRRRYRRRCYFEARGAGDWPRITLTQVSHMPDVYAKDRHLRRSAIYLEYLRG